MFNEIVRRLNGHGEDPESLVTALTQLAVERDAANVAVTQLHERRRQALLDDASDGALDKLEREISRAEIRIEKLGIAEPSLRERLTVAQAAARRRRWQAHIDAYRLAAADFLASARAAAEKHAALMAVIEQTHREGFENEAAAAMPSTPHIGGNALLAPDLLDLFERAIAPRAQHLPIPVTPAAKPPGVRAPLPHERRRATDSQKQVSLALDGRPPHKQSRPADDRAALLPGEARVRVLRHGYSPADDRPQCAFGQIVRMPLALAKRAADAGAAEILETSDAPATSATGADWETPPAEDASL